MSRDLDRLGRQAWAILAVGLAVLLLLHLLTGCATGRVDPDGTLYAAAIGDGAVVERCVPVECGAGVLAGVTDALHGREEACSRVKGGSISGGILDALGGVLKAAWSFLPALIP